MQVFLLGKYSKFVEKCTNQSKAKNVVIKTELTAIMDLCLKENINAFNLARVELEHAVASKDLNGKL